MDLYDLIEDLRDAVARDAAAVAWSVSNYGKTHNVFIDQDPENPPGESAAPDVQFHSPSKGADEEKRNIDYGFGVFVSIKDESEVSGGDANVTEFTATQKVNQYVVLILAAIRSAKPANYYMSYDYLIDTISNFPIFEVDIAVSFSEKVLIGQDPLA